jgi:hypothetical protein
MAPMTARTAAAPSGYLFMPPLVRRRAKALIWLRRTHAWLGLWGAGLALLFGTTGFLLNHRLVMKVPAAHIEQTVFQVPLQVRPSDAQALALQLQKALRADRPATLVRVEPAQDVMWNGETVRQPELWRVFFVTPARALNVEYWAGNAYATVKRQDPNAWALLTRLHTGTGATVAWVLLVDTLAGALVTLALTGFMLWSGLHGTRVMALAIGLGSIILTFSLAWRAM